MSEEKTVINLAELIERKRDEGGVQIDLGDNDVVTIPPAELWPDDLIRKFEDADNATAAKAIMGAEKWKKFTAAGGTAAVFFELVNAKAGTGAGE